MKVYSERDTTVVDCWYLEVYNLLYSTTARDNPPSRHSDTFPASHKAKMTRRARSKTAIIRPGSWFRRASPRRLCLYFRQFLTVPTETWSLRRSPSVRAGFWCSQVLLTASTRSVLYRSNLFLALLFLFPFALFFLLLPASFFLPRACQVPLVHGVPRKAEGFCH